MRSSVTRLLRLSPLIPLFGWLLWAAASVDVEYYDGFETVLNSQYFLGRVPYYNALRGPLIAALLIPAEWFKLKLGLHPLEVRPHHLTMALVHGAYLVAALGLIRRFTQSHTAALLAFFLAVTNWLFFAYAPFLNHDLLPGVLFLGMLVGGMAFLEEGGVWRLLAVASLGAAAPLIKLQFGVFFIALLVAASVEVIRTRSHFPERSRRLGALFGAAAVAGAGVWLVLAAVLGDTWPDASFILRPWRMLEFQARSTLTRESSAWLYLQNVGAYGWSSALLVLPGLWLAFRGSSQQRMVATGWLIAAAATQLLAHREVRYLAFLGPLSAALIAPVLARWLARPRLRWGCFALAALDLALALPEATHLSEPFYRHSAAKEFLAPLGLPPAPHPPLVLVGDTFLSFRDPEPSPLRGDPYHRVFHLSFHHYLSLWGYSPDEFSHLATPRGLEARHREQGVVLVVTRGRLRSLSSSPREADPPFDQKIALAERAPLSSSGQLFECSRCPGAVRLSTEKPNWILEGAGVRWLDGLLFPSLVEEAPPGVFPLHRREDGSYAVEGAPVAGGTTSNWLSGYRPN